MFWEQVEDSKVCEEAFGGSGPHQFTKYLTLLSWRLVGHVKVGHLPKEHRSLPTHPSAKKETLKSHKLKYFLYVSHMAPWQKSLLS